MTNKYFFLMASPFEGSDHIKPPDHKGPSNGDCSESGMVCKKLATDATLNKVLCGCSGRRPIETCTEGLSYKGPGCGVVPAESSVNFSQEISPFLFGDTPLKDFGRTFLVELSFMNLVGF